MEKQYDIGVLGLGVMGSALAKNILDHDFNTALFSVSEKERTAFYSENGLFRLCTTIEELIGCLKTPRKIFIMITAGKPVDSVINQLLPMLEKGDIIMDGGNSYYKDTKRRCETCERQGIHYLGVGVSGGESGARNGPSIMVGGSKSGFKMVQEILDTIAAKHDRIPCCTYIAENGAGHYVKMVHNGIEYAILELLAESYHYMRFFAKMEPEEIRCIFLKWNNGRLNSYLIEISALVLGKKEEDGCLVLDKILDIAEQKGTGAWTVSEGIERGVYIPTIYEAQAARAFSKYKTERTLGAEQLTCHPILEIKIEPDELEDALLLAIIIAYSQGLELIRHAAIAEGWDIDFAALIAVWKEGCIIRSRLLEEIELVKTLKESPLLLASEFSYVNRLEISLRKLAVSSVASGHAMHGFCSALNNYDSYRMKQMPVNFVQALRDCFGSHTYRRIDKEGYYHTSW